MSRTACLIIAYSAAPVLARAAPVFRDADWDIFVHIDRKADAEAYRGALGRAAELCRFVSDPVEVFWGGYSMIEAELRLIRTARAHAAYDRFLLISDDTFPVLPGRALAAGFAAQGDMIHASLQHPPSPYRRRYDDFYYLDHPITGARRNLHQISRFDALFEEKVADALALRRIGKKPIDLYYGMQFWSLTADTVNAVVDTVESDEYLRRSFEFSALSDETMIQSIVGARAGADQETGPVYADFFLEGPRVFRRTDQLPRDLQSIHLLLRKMDPDSPAFLDHLAQHLNVGRTIFGTAPDAMDPSAPLPIQDADGHPATLIPLFAPEARSAPGWHGLESFWGRRYRYSGVDRITWQLRAPLPGGRLRFLIPCVIGIGEEFARGCALNVGSQNRTLRRTGAGLEADFHTGSEITAEVTMTTPPPASPSPGDSRKLGLAIAVRHSSVHA